MRGARKEGASLISPLRTYLFTVEIYFQHNGFYSNSQNAECDG